MNNEKKFFCDVKPDVEDRECRRYLIKVLNGEIVYASRCTTYTDTCKDKYPHNLFNGSYGIHWDSVKKYLKYFYKEKRKEFYEVFKNLSLDSKAHKIAKEIISERYDEILKEKEQIEGIISSYF